MKTLSLTLTIVFLMGTSVQSFSRSLYHECTGIAESSRSRNPADFIYRANDAMSRIKFDTTDTQKLRWSIPLKTAFAKASRTLDTMPVIIGIENKKNIIDLFCSFNKYRAYLEARDDDSVDTQPCISSLLTDMEILEEYVQFPANGKCATIEDAGF